MSASFHAFGGATAGAVSVRDAVSLIIATVDNGDRVWMQIISDAVTGENSGITLEGLVREESLSRQSVTQDIAAARARSAAAREIDRAG